jgi:hypothetical protein
MLETMKKPEKTERENQPGFRTRPSRGSISKPSERDTHPWKGGEPFKTLHPVVDKGFFSLWGKEAPKGIGGAKMRHQKDLIEVVGENEVIIHEDIEDDPEPIDVDDFLFEEWREELSRRKVKKWLWSKDPECGNLLLETRNPLIEAKSGFAGSFGKRTLTSLQEEQAFALKSSKRKITGALLSSLLKSSERQTGFGMWSWRMPLNDQWESNGKGWQRGYSFSKSPALLCWPCVCETPWILADVRLDLFHWSKEEVEFDWRC